MSRRYAFVLVPGIATASQTPSGWYGFTDGPPIVVHEQAAGGERVSRTISASMRKRGPRDSSRFSGSF